MNTPILHHYPASPFAEKARLMLGHKRLAWHSVIIPSIMPKPDLMPLTGGYRRTPVLQVGADIYCDTALIARVLERMHPSPTMYSDHGAASDLALALFGDQQMFSAAVGYAMQPAGLAVMFAGLSREELDAFSEDRKNFRKGASTLRMSLADATALLMWVLPRLDAQLSDGRHYLAGETVRAVDFSVYHPLWFIQRAGPMAGVLEPYPHLRGWLGRIAAIGHGSPTTMSGQQAIDVARASVPALLPGRSLREVDGAGVGDVVSVAPTDYGVDAVTGTLANADAESIAVRRTDPRVGDVVVHFPRHGFRVAPA